jgi:hypothetical protein
MQSIFPFDARNDHAHQYFPSAYFFDKTHSVPFLISVTSLGMVRQQLHSYTTTA